VARFRFRIRPGENKSDPYFLWPPDGTLPEGWEDGVFWDEGGFGIAVWSAPVELRKLQIVFSRVAPGTVASDPAVCTMHFLNLTGGSPDSTWVDADFLVVETALMSAWDSLKGYWTTGTTLDQLRWYKDGSAFHPTPSEGNPAVRIVEKDVAGQASVPPMAPQVAVSITEKTALRRRWGRFYLPAPARGNEGTGGTILGTLTTDLADVFHTFFEACRTGDIIPVVFSPSLEAAYEVEHLQVDNLFDVIRSRRWKGPTVRETRNLID
jgi:hypothetical protein